MFVHHLDIVVIEPHPPVLYLYYRDVVAMLISLTDVDDNAVETVELLFSLLVVVLHYSQCTVLRRNWRGKAICHRILDRPLIL